MSLNFLEKVAISQADLRILNPFSEDKLLLLGEICDISADTEVLDLACGKGELLSQWAARYGAVGTGVDISPVFLDEARERAAELTVADRLTFREEDTAEYPIEEHTADIVSCLGATWIGDGLSGTLKLMNRATNDESSLLLVGEPYWIEEPPAKAVQALVDGERDLYGTLPEVLGRIQDSGFTLIEMVLGNRDTWDRYEATQWKTVDDWVRNNPDNPNTEEMQTWIDDNRQRYLQYGRKYLGWGVFVLRETPEGN